jgi:hypothetical protein
MRALLVACLLVLALPGAAAAETLAAQSGDVQATLSWVEQDYSAYDVRLVIVRGGLTLHDAPILDEDGQPTIDTPQALWAVDLDGDTEPEVVVDLYTNGAHCCLYSLIYRYVDGMPPAYHAVPHAWGNVGYRLEDLDGDGLPEFHSADDRFAYAFTAYAGSGFPIQIWRYEGSAFEAGLRDVTRDFPKLIRKDAVRWWKLYLRDRGTRHGDVRGVLAAWLADKYLLGERSDGWHKLALARRAGYLTGPEGWPSGRRYVAALKSFLARLGYDE